VKCVHEKFASVRDDGAQYSRRRPKLKIQAGKQALRGALLIAVAGTPSLHGDGKRFLVTAPQSRPASIPAATRSR
jgi:hypothetical protein